MAAAPALITGLCGANFDQLPEPKGSCGYLLAVSPTLEIDAHLLARFRRAR